MLKEYISTPQAIAFAIMMFLMGLRLDVGDKWRDRAGALYIISCIVVAIMGSVLN